MVIVESPAKAKTIQKFLGPNYMVDYCAGIFYSDKFTTQLILFMDAIITGSLGHIRDLPNRSSKLSQVSLKKEFIQKDLNINVRDLGVNVYNNFEPLWVPMEGQKYMASFHECILSISLLCLKEKQIS